eukprot:CAMPEP_0170621536 /NCGR_PEP_ID=MMETSP0224-20130122/28649_1 /TAXON_ID=285029 /ORGANISM="Togula jolla, Strain CCCM 725" /LENGTH=2149 /DNA_ID=CAMNT_0010947793 /DNA_START=63 /DNA_END=6512 /DNA_ORIENTATION=-
MSAAASQAPAVSFLSPSVVTPAGKVPKETSNVAKVNSVVGLQAQSAPNSQTFSAGSTAALVGAALGGATVVNLRGRRKKGRTQTRAIPGGVANSRVVSVSTAAVAAMERDIKEQVDMTPEELLEQYVKEKGGSRVIKKILIANNGMAATKAILSMRQWAYLQFGSESVIQFVVMATPEDLDANAEFIRLADTYVEVPGGKNVNNYANVQLIIDMAKKYSCDAVWPGWGHASENPKLPAGLSKEGIIFIGPTSPVMSVLGDKIAANILAQTAGVNSIPWSGDGLKAELTDEGTIPDEIFQKGLINSMDQAIECANRIGYPVMLKASEGGGGKGIRMSANEEELAANYPQVLAEVPGSPVFMMQLCTGARHIEVQIVGDMHGNAVALNGRDCSTQRRFQKIFEEGPPSIVPKDTFTEMERAAQRLTQSIGYLGAGTVEYLYNAASNEYYFLELNPRLQVEHPVTEEITGVNLPATQLQVVMGIPLENIPQVRKFYGKAPDDTSGIDFLKDSYVYPDRHVIAARITAENPDDGFKPTSGKIQRIKFQSSVNCWGYFSVGANGGIHEYADSQFGHIFAHGANRNDARRALILALKNMNVVGEIRNPVEYLVELASTEAFRENTIDTSWLDGIIKEKSVKPSYDNFDVVFYSAIFRAMESLEGQEKDIKDALAAGQLAPVQKITTMNSFPIEIIFEGKRYTFKVERGGSDILKLTIGDKKIVAKVRRQPDGAIFVKVGNTVMNVAGAEEPLGLRLRLEGISTIMVPTVYDPSEMRSEFNGKVVRFLQDSGGVVKAGQPYVELEAMKMIMPVKAMSSGRITHLKSPGSIVAAGDLLGSVELDDPSSVQTIDDFTGDFALGALSDAAAPEETPFDTLFADVKLLLDGFAPAANPSEMVQMLFKETPAENWQSVASEIFEKYLSVEEEFASVMSDDVTSADQITAALIAKHKDAPETVMALSLAHGQLVARNEVVLTTLRDTRWAVPGRTASDRLKACLDRLSQLPSSGGYGPVVMVSSQVSEKITIIPFEDRQQKLAEMLTSVDSAKISAMSAVDAGAELLCSLMGDESEDIRSKAMEGYVKRSYRSFQVSNMELSAAAPWKLSASFNFQYPGAQGSEGTRGCFCTTVSSIKDLPSVFEQIPASFKEEVPSKIIAIVGPDAFSATATDRSTFYSSDAAFTATFEEAGAQLQAAAGTLKAAGVTEFVLTLLQPPLQPRYACFMAKDDWKESSTRRDMKPVNAYLLEVNRIAEEYELERIIPTIGRNSMVYLGASKVAKAGRRGPPKTVFVRMITHTMKAAPGESGWETGPTNLLLAGIDELERARLSPKVGAQPNSSIFAHLMWLVDLEPEKANEVFQGFLDQFVSKHGDRLQQMKVDEIVIKVGLGKTAGGPREHTLRVTASSMTGEYLKTFGLLEIEDPVTTKLKEWVDVKTRETTSLDAFSTSPLLSRRIIARAAGSTYAPEFLGMMKVELIKRWAAYEQLPGAAPMPSSVFEGKELVLGADGVLSESDRNAGMNDIGMVAWRCTMRTPEYPEGRSIVLISNDVTTQAGSFGVDEDIFFQKASEYARKSGLPRIYIACNSGARVGLVEELKEIVKAKWSDPENPSKGFDYLYIEEADYAKLKPGTVEAHEVEADGSKHYQLDAIIGLEEKSTAGGIGVENLKGSGLIAGETARAYNEVFTLSYVTGRSVGIGAYLNRLGQRVIQMVNGPMILTGFGALNKLLGRSVYTSQDQLGGPQVMVPNGVTHQLVQSDQEGVAAIMDWLSFVPKDTYSIPAMLKPVDPIEREVTFTPSKTPYDPRHMLAGTKTLEGSQLSGFFDEGTFKEYLGGWGKSVITGRAKLGGIPMGVIAVETRSVERRIPADPANPLSKEVIEPQAGQVWFPDSAFKTATAIRDFNRGENLPLMIFANWRGFSGGTRDMYSEVLKFGAQIVDALVDYKHPVFVYIPPGGELRGGAWVVIDPSINPDQMEMYADVESRGGILEPPGIVEVKFRAPQQVQLMHRLDPTLASLDADLAAGGGDSTEIKEKIKAREEQLLPLYTQIACEFADLHDRTGRMAAKGVIRKPLEWRNSREFFYWRVRRRLLEQEVIAKVLKADPQMTLKESKELVSSWVEGGDDDKSAVAFLEKSSLDSKIESVRVEAVKRRIKELEAQLK